MSVLLLTPRPSAPLSFADFLESSPGLSANARDMYLRIDTEAVRIGREIAASHGEPAELRRRAADYARRGLSWLAGTNVDIADALEIDIRLAALPTLQAQAQGQDGIGRTWINWYAVMLNAHVEHAAGPKLALVAAE